MFTIDRLCAALRERKAAAQSEVAAATIELAAHLFDFPELRLRYPTAALDAFLAAGGEASALRSLDDYDERETISHTRNEVEKAVYQGSACALKLFKLAGASAQRAYLKEARRLRQLAHPHVVELRAVFVDGKTSTGVLEMPLYAHRDLWHWLEAAPRNVHEKLTVLRQALCGLEHVHRAGVVHADVKPENVFVSGDGSAKLGDVDISHDDAMMPVGFTRYHARGARAAQRLAGEQGARRAPRTF